MEISNEFLNIVFACAMLYFTPISMLYLLTELGKKKHNKENPDNQVPKKNFFAFVLFFGWMFYLARWLFTDYKDHSIP